MDPTYVVALPVLANECVILADDASTVWPSLAGAAPPPIVLTVGNGTIRGVTISLVATNCRSSCTRPNGSTVRTVSGPVEKRPRTRPSNGYSTTRRQL